MTLYLLNFNNYYNRIVKKYDTIEEYDSWIVDQVSATNFAARDGISTTHIANTEQIADYAILVGDNNEILSRWYVVEAMRTRKGQYNLSLYRDVVADWWDQIVAAPMFLEKGWLAANDPAIFNSESLTFNQVKTKERLLKDESGIPWIVGYYAKDATNISGAVPMNPLNDLNYIQLASPIKNWEYAQYTEDTPFISSYTNGRVVIRSYQEKGLAFYLDNINYNINYYENGEVQIDVELDNVQARDPRIRNGAAINVGPFREAYTPELVNQVKTQLPAYITTKTAAERNELLSYNGKLVRDTAGRYFRVSVVNGDTKDFEYPVAAGSLFNTMTTIMANTLYGDNPMFITAANSSSFAAFGTSPTLYVQLTEEVAYETTYNITAANDRLITTDAPYNIFAIPCGEAEVREPFSDETLCVTSAEMAFAVAAEIQRAHQSNIYDIQLVPYCPVQELINPNDGTLIAPTGTKHYSPIVSQERTVGIIYNVPSATFTFNTQIGGLGAATTAIEKKINNECDFYRLTSPNYSNYFDFSKEKNNGISYFNVDCEYKPFAPYIHVNPNFGGLYGRDFNDVRGLILGGDFSLPQVGDAWEQYKIQNKNFQETFDRQIQNMEVNNNAARIGDWANAAVGTAQGVATGAMAGAMSGGMISMAKGGIVGGVTSAIGGAADIVLNEVLRNEAMDYTKDLFGYNLQNIRALPQTISKVSSFNPNNKIFPILEYYTATETEKQALRDKITYNGMTIMRIGTLNQFIINDTVPHYYKGQLIRIEGINEEAHVAQTIANELNKGVYI